MIGKLARRLEKEPNDLQGWLMLGRSYLAVEQYPLAERAYARANRLADGKDAEALAGQAEALLMQDDAQLEGRAGELFEQALRIEPQMQKALFFGGIAAMRRGDLPLARDRFQKLLASNPPENVRPLLQQQLDAIEAQLGGKAPASAGTATDVAPAAQAAASASASSPAGEPASGSASVRVAIDVAPAIRARIADGAPLFVFVRDSQAPGPPLAVKRLASRFPQEVELTGADSMTGDAALAAGREVTVVARVSLGGVPTARAGDPFGEIRYRIGKNGRATLTIDRVTP
jgi:cytochrome c-type biogenesis protein CcmH